MKSTSIVNSTSLSTASSSVNGKGHSEAAGESSYLKNGKGARVRISDTSKTKPIISIEKLARKAKNTKLQPGDIVLTTSRKSPMGTPASFFGEGSQVVQGGFNHAAMYVGNNKIVEGRVNEGVTEKTLDNAVKDLSFTTVRPNLSLAKRKRAAQIAKRQIGKTYSMTDLVNTGAAIALLPEPLRETILKPKEKENLQDLNSMQCGALIAGAYEKATNNNLTNLNYRYVAPVDLLSRVDGKIVKVDTKKGKQGVSFSLSESARKASRKYKQYMEKAASSGCLTVFCHVDATDWCPDSTVVKGLAQFFTKNVKVEIYPRYLASTVWEKDHPGKTYDKGYYAFRAYAGRDYCKIFVDETETRDSALWVMLHELAHIALASSPFLFRAYRHLTPDNYFESDEAHESDPEEQMANAMAMSWMDMLGYGKVNYPRHWWRERTIMNKKASALGMGLLGAGAGAGIAGASSYLKQKQDAEDRAFRRAMAGKRGLTKKQKEKLSNYQRRQAIRAALRGGVLGGGLGATAGYTGDRFKKGFNWATSEGKRALDDSVDKGIQKGEKAIKKSIDDATDTNAAKVREQMDQVLYGTEDKPGGVIGEVDRQRRDAQTFLKNLKTDTLKEVDEAATKHREGLQEYTSGVIDHLDQEAIPRHKKELEEALNRQRAGVVGDISETLYGTRQTPKGGLFGGIAKERQAIDEAVTRQREGLQEYGADVIDHLDEAAGRYTDKIEAAVDSQRRDTLQRLSAERKALQKGLSEERKAILKGVSDERKAVKQDVSDTLYGEGSAGSPTPIPKGGLVGAIGKEREALQDYGSEAIDYLDSAVTRQRQEGLQDLKNAYGQERANTFADIRELKNETLDDAHGLVDRLPMSKKRKAPPPTPSESTEVAPKSDKKPWYKKLFSKKASYDALRNYNNNIYRGSK